MPRVNSSSDPLTQKSKYVSYLLRHDLRVGDLVDEKGFASLKQLNQVIKKDGHKLVTEQDLIAVTNNPNTKKRFEFEYRPVRSQDQGEDPIELALDRRMLYIRALNGHSFPLKSNIFDPYVIDPNITEPIFLYHVTNHKTVDTIMQEGLKPMTRQFVHLYENKGQIKFDSKRNTVLQIGPVNSQNIDQKPKLNLHRAKNGYIMSPDVIPPELINKTTR